MAKAKKMAVMRANKSTLDQKRLAMAFGVSGAVGGALMSGSMSATRMMGGWGNFYGNWGMMGGGVPLVNMVGALIWGFAMGAFMGWLVAWVYNKA